MSITKIRKTDFCLSGQRVILVQGSGFFNMQELFRKIGQQSLRYNQIRSHVFQDTNEYIAVILMPEKTEKR